MDKELLIFAWDLNIGLMSAWMTNVQVLERQVIISLELYWKGLTFIFNGGIWDVSLPCNYIPTALTLTYISKIKFHFWVCACISKGKHRQFLTMKWWKYSEANFNIIKNNHVLKVIITFNTYNGFPRYLLTETHSKHQLIFSWYFFNVFINLNNIAYHHYLY